MLHRGEVVTGFSRGRLKTKVLVRDFCKFSVFYQNVQGLNTKLSVLHENILLNSFSVVALTETWISDNVLDSEIVDTRYQLFRCDRDSEVAGKERGGGVLLAVDVKFACVRLDLNLPGTEQIFLKVMLKCYSFHVCLVCFLPTTKLGLYTKFFLALKMFLPDSNTLLLLGFNVPEFADSSYCFNLGSSIFKGLSGFIEYYSRHTTLCGFFGQKPVERL